MHRVRVWVWLAAPLIAPAATLADESSKFQRDFSEAERSHWAFQPIKRPRVPSVRDASWLRNPVDAFILSRLERAEIQPAPQAGRLKLLRRVYLDLLGLPPTPHEQRAFLEDRSPDAYEKVVDDLLCRPQFGERWARHWLDVVRYAESNGYERDGTKPHAWRYRDYVIDSFNRDAPYDQFLTEQLAGDEIDDSSARTQIATSFLRLGTWDDEPADERPDRYDQLDDVLGATSLAFLGLTIQCARCHEHKFEPITQLDYSRLLAIFEPLKRPQEGRKDLDWFVGPAAEVDAYRRTAERLDARIGDLKKRIEALDSSVRERILSEKKTSLSAEAVVAFQTKPENRTAAQKELVKKFASKLDQEVHAALSPEQKAQRSCWKQEMEAVDRTRPAEPMRAYIWYEDGSPPPKTHVFVRGNPSRPAMAVEPGTPAILAASALPEPPRPTERSTGRRRWLARWMTAPANPLVARVIVNRLWHYHFGEGIVRTENDFGLLGERPTHPELLDWLAATLQENGWQVKPIHRLLVLSSTYRTASLADQDALTKDPEERLWWRWRVRRLDAEAFRDLVLAACGDLNLKMAGPSVYPRIAQAVLEGQSRPGDGWGHSPPSEAARRSVYIFIKRSLMVPELELLDSPAGTACCEQRPSSTTAPQALTLLNGQFMNDAARALARRLIREAGPARQAQVRRAFELVLCRPPRPDDIAAVSDFLERFSAQLPSLKNAKSTDPANVDPALVAFCLVLFNTNEAIYCD